MRQVNLPASVAIQFSVGAILLGSLSLATERREAINWSAQLVVSLLVLGVLVSWATLLMVYWLLTKLEAWQVAALQWIATLVAVGEAAWFLRAKLSGNVGRSGNHRWSDFWFFRGDGEAGEEGVTLQITNRTFGAVNGIRI